MNTLGVFFVLLAGCLAVAGAALYHCVQWCADGEPCEHVVSGWPGASLVTFAVGMAALCASFGTYLAWIPGAESPMRPLLPGSSPASGRTRPANWAEPEI